MFVQCICSSNIYICVTGCLDDQGGVSLAALYQRPKKSKLSAWQILTSKIFPDRARKSFLRQMRKKVRKWFSRSCFATHMYQKWLIYFQTICKVSRGPEKLSDHTESFQTIRKVDHPESFQTIRKVSRPS